MFQDLNKHITHTWSEYSDAKTTWCSRKQEHDSTSFRNFLKFIEKEAWISI